MKRVALVALLLTVVGLLPLLGSCVVAVPPDVVFVPAPPPLAEVEVVGVAPGPEFVWIHGFHRWNGTAYVWAPGRWERRPRAGAVWVNGSWVHHRKGWWWREGHWR